MYESFGTLNRQNHKLLHFIFLGSYFYTLTVEVFSFVSFLRTGYNNKFDYSVSGAVCGQATPLAFRNSLKFVYGDSR